MKQKEYETYKNMSLTSRKVISSFFKLEKILLANAFISISDNQNLIVEVHFIFVFIYQRTKAFYNKESRHAILTVTISTCTIIVPSIFLLKNKRNQNCKIAKLEKKWKVTFNLLRRWRLRPMHQLLHFLRPSEEG
jgi:hypothetical protein